MPAGARFTPASSSANLYAQVVKRLAPRKLVELAEDADQRVVRRLHGEVLDLAAGPTCASMRPRRRELEARARSRSACSSAIARSRTSAGPRSAAIHCRDSSDMPGISCTLAPATTRA